MKILICDDSALARKSLFRYLDSQFDIEVSFSTNGQEALNELTGNNIDILFLDLTMPVMDGFDVLQALPVNDYKTEVIVISGDVQKEAKSRCLSLGASAFINKPFNKEELYKHLQKYHLPEKTDTSAQQPTPTDANTEQLSNELNTATKFRELANIALGVSAAFISDRVGVFIQMPLPTVGKLEVSEVTMMVTDALNREEMHAVTQRFVGSGIHGEAIVCMRGDGIHTIGELLGFPSDEYLENEIVLNMSNLLVATFLNSIAEQLLSTFSLRQPSALNYFYEDSLSLKQVDKGVFAVEYTYYAENLDFECEVILVFDSESEQTLYRQMELL